MRLPPSLLVQLGPSRAAGVAIGLMGAATLGVVLALPIAAWQQAGLVTGVAAWAWRAWRMHALRHGADACIALRLAPNRLLTATMGDGRLLAGHVRSSSYVGARLTTIVWRADGERRSRSVWILPDMLPADDFRRLRVLLRYARSGDVPGSPASHR